MDGHSSHFSLEVCRLAKEKNISLIVFPPHSSHALQPLDVAVFGPVKKAWRQLVEEHARSNNFQNVEKADFAPLFAKITDRNLGFLRGHVVSGFERTGIYPLNPAMLFKKITLYPTSQLTNVRGPSQSIVELTNDGAQNQLMIESTNVRGPSQSIVESTNDAAQSPLVGSAAINQKSNQKGCIDELIELEDTDSVSEYSGERMEWSSTDSSQSTEDESMDSMDSDLESYVMKQSLPPPPPPPAPQPILSKCAIESRMVNSGSSSQVMANTEQGLSNAVKSYISASFAQNPKKTTKRNRINRTLAECVTEEQIQELQIKRDKQAKLKQEKAELFC